jgi:hypothetical protein
MLTVLKSSTAIFSKGGILPEALGAYNFEVMLNKDDCAWKVTAA